MSVITIHVPPDDGGGRPGGPPRLSITAEYTPPAGESQVQTAKNVVKIEKQLSKVTEKWNE